MSYESLPGGLKLLLSLISVHSKNNNINKMLNISE